MFLQELSFEKAVEDADVPVLLVSVAQLTGDLSLLRDEFRPDTTNLFDPAAGLSPEAQAEGRRLAAQALRKYIEEGRQPAPQPRGDQLVKMIAFLVGDEPADAYLELLREELGQAGTDPRAPSWNARDIAPQRTFSVAVIGAGMSGIAVAHRLRQAGLSVTI